MSFLEINPIFQFSISTSNQSKHREQFEVNKQSSFWRTLDRYSFISTAPFQIPSKPFPVYCDAEFIAIGSVEDLIIKARKRNKWYTLHTISIPIDPYPQYAQITIIDQRVYYVNSCGHLYVYSLFKGTLIESINVLETICEKMIIRTPNPFKRVICPLHIYFSNTAIYFITYTGQIVYFTLNYNLFLLQGIFELNKLVLYIKDNRLITVQSCYDVSSPSIFNITAESIK